MHPHLTPPLSPRGALVAALLVSTGLLGTGCRPSGGETATVTFSIAVDTVALQPSLRSRVWRAAARGGTQEESSPAFSFADVTSIRVDVRETDTEAPIYVNFDLTLGAGGWTGSLPFLPKGRSLTFLARALSASNEVLFNGSTQQTLTADNEHVTVTLASVNDGVTIDLPRIKKIAIPQEFVSNRGGNIIFTVEASVGERLAYTILPAAGGGAFYPESGTLTLESLTGSFVIRYAPPVTLTSTTVFSHQVKVTNAAGHAVTTTFKTQVVPLATGGDANGTNMVVLFNPVINTLEASRVAGTGDVFLRASVADDGPASELSYRWSFTPSVSVDPAPTFSAQANPTTLQNYTSTLAGTLKLEVTDGTAGTTTVFYALQPNQFPDVPDVVGSLQSIHARGNQTCLLFNTGALRCWGRNAQGQLGLGNNNDVGDNELPSPAGDVPLTEVVSQVAVGGQHTCALLGSGYVRCWGYNAKGQLGLGHTNSLGDDEPITSQSYVNLGTRVAMLATGEAHTCALLPSGKVRCWGDNSKGQLGYGHTQSIGDDEQVWDIGDVQVGATVQDIVAGGNHTCALLLGGKVRCWGHNANGQLGYGHTNDVGDNEHPASAGDVNVGGTVLQLTAGLNHTCALLATGKVRCWGANGNGQLGLGHTNDVTSPASAGDVNAQDLALQVAAGNQHTCALLSSGRVKCWGLNNKGQLGQGNTSTYDVYPGATVALGGTVYSLSAGNAHTCALLDSGVTRCWGENTYGQLGLGHTRHLGDDEPVEPIPGNLTSLRAGGNHTCALLTDGSMRCWGYNGYGRLGLGHVQTIGDNEAPYVAGALVLGGTVATMAMGGSHSCALLSTGNVSCWGYNGYGQLGYAHAVPIGDNEYPSSAGYVSLGSTATKLALGGHHTCAVHAGGQVSCWGHNVYGQLGYAHVSYIGDNEHPSSAGYVSVGGTVRDVVAGSYHTCALLTNGKVRCWGYNNVGQLGNSNTSNNIGDTETPASAGDVDVGGTVVQLAAGNNHSCALLATGQVRCWGLNNYGQLGYGHTSNVSVPSSAGDVNTGGTVLQVAAAGNHTCALLATGQVRCWGYNGNGQLGLGHTTAQSAPPAATVNLGGAAVWQLTAGDNYTCALLNTGQARCWGYNGNGELGQGNTVHIGDNELPSAISDIRLLAP